MEPNTAQGIPPIRTMPQAPALAPRNRRKKTIIILVSIFLLLDVALAVYWFYFRDTALTEQDKLTILEELKQSSTIDFTPEAKDQIMTNLTSESQTQNPTAANMSDEEKLAIVNSLGGQK
jgi:flagellar basal body-associated protein FliL